MALATSKVLGKKQKCSKPRSEWVFLLLLHNNQPTDEWERTTERNDDMIAFEK